MRIVVLRQDEPVLTIDQVIVEGDAGGATDRPDLGHQVAQERDRAGDRLMSPSGSWVAADTADSAASSTYFSHFTTWTLAAAVAPTPPARAVSRMRWTRGVVVSPSHSPNTMLRGPLAATTPGR